MRSVPFGQALADEIERAGERQREAAARVGISQQTLSAICAGARNPTLDSVLRLIVAYPRLLFWLGNAAFERSNGNDTPRA